MSVMKRLSGIVQAKANKALDKAENPADMLDLSYEKQMGGTSPKVRRALADVATARKRLEAPGPPSSRARPQKCRTRPSRRSSQGQEDLAREALGLGGPRLADQLESLGHPAPAGRGPATDSSKPRASRLQAQVGALQTKKETLEGELHRLEGPGQHR